MLKSKQISFVILNYINLLAVTRATSTRSISCLSWEPHGDTVSKPRPMARRVQILSKFFGIHFSHKSQILCEFQDLGEYFGILVSFLTYLPFALVIPRLWLCIDKLGHQNEPKTSQSGIDFLLITTLSIIKIGKVRKEFGGYINSRSRRKTLDTSTRLFYSRDSLDGHKYL